MRKVVFLLIASLAIAFTACNKEKIDKVNPDDITVNADKAALQQRIEMINAPVTFNSFKSSADVTPIPELWAVARILPATRTITVYNWSKVDANGVTHTRTTATNDAPTITIAATPANPTAQLTLDFVNTTAYPDQTLSITGAAVENAGAGDFYAYFSSHINNPVVVGGQKTGVYGGEIFKVKYINADASPISAEFSIFDNESDYNDVSIDADDEKLWIVGDNNARGAIVRNPTLASLHALAADVDQNIGNPNPVSFTMPKFNIPLLGPSGNSVTVPQLDVANNESDYVWIVAGGTSYGGLAVFSKTDATRLFTRTDRANAKHFDMGELSHGSGLYGAFLYGNYGVAGGTFDDNLANLRIFNTSGGPFSYKDFTIPADVTFEGKNAIDVDDDSGTPGGDQHIYLAMGADGVWKVNVSDFYAAAAPPPGVQALTTGNADAIAGTFDDLVKFDGVDSFGQNGLANGLVVLGDYVYVAYGASGLVILDKATMTMVGQYNGIGSCNYVAVDTFGGDTILWAGFGTGGMIMFKFANVVTN